MKPLLIIFLLCIAVSSIAFDIPPDKGIHFTGCCALTIVLDVCGCPVWANLLTVSLISVGKELSDPTFNVNDLYADGMGIMFGFAVRF
jgi:hypothetical protein